MAQPLDCAAHPTARVGAEIYIAHPICCEFASAFAYWNLITRHAPQQARPRYLPGLPGFAALSLLCICGEDRAAQRLDHRRNSTFNSLHRIHRCFASIRFEGRRLRVRARGVKMRFVSDILVLIKADSWSFI
jgi:hypothetical protein